MAQKSPNGERQKIKQRVQEVTVLESELKSLKKNAKVYKQQPNSQVFFRSDMAQVMSECKKELDDLQKEYKELEKTQEEQTQQEEKTELEDGNDEECSIQDLRLTAK